MARPRAAPCLFIIRSFPVLPSHLQCFFDPVLDLRVESSILEGISSHQFQFFFGWIRKIDQLTIDSDSGDANVRHFGFRVITETVRNFNIFAL